MLPFEKNTVLFYKYFFYGIDEPIIIEALNKDQADDLLEHQMRMFPQLQQLQLVDERVTTPISGVTEKQDSTGTYVWVGFDKAVTGWMNKEAFLKTKFKP